MTSNQSDNCHVQNTADINETTELSNTKNTRKYNLRVEVGVWE